MAPGRGRASIIGRLLRGLLAVAVVFATLEASARLVLSRDVISERVRGTSSAAWRLDWIDRHRDGVEVYYSFDVYLREEGLRYHPDIVLVGFVQDDMERNMLEFRDYAKPRFDLVDGALALRNSPVPVPSEMLARERYRSRFLDLVDMVAQATLWRSGVNQRRMEAVTAALLDEIADESAAAGAATAFFYLPHSEELTNPDLTLDAERFFTDYCGERDALCLNLRPTFLERMAQGYAVKAPGHWHGSGHQLVAETLSAFLAEKGLAPS